MRSDIRHRLSSPGVIAAIALVLTAIVIVGALEDVDWDPTLFIGFGEDAGATREYGQDLLGEIFLREEQGHDGKFFFVQANDPWLISPQDHAALLDFPVYRSRRMLYPLLAGGLGLFPPELIVWSLLGVNVGAMGLGTLGTSRLAIRLGGSPWWGLVFFGNVGLLFALTNTGAGILAAALAVWGVVMLYEGRIPFAIGFLTGSVLSREVMLLSAVGVAIWFWTQRRKLSAVYAIAVPLAALGIWEGYLRIRLGADLPGLEAVGLPFAGIVSATAEWSQEPLTLVTGLSVIAILAIFVRRWAVGRTALGWAFVGFVPLALVLSDRVWREMFDFSRALAPLLTAAILLVFVEPNVGERQTVRVAEGSSSYAEHGAAAASGGPNSG